VTEPDQVLYEVEDQVATVTLNRPDRLNAITGQMLNELADRFLEADADVDVRAVVLTGAGRGFCSGLDMIAASSGTGIGSGSGSGALPHTRTLPTNVLHNMDTPVIGAINGPAAGYGLDLALGCDMRIGGESTRLIPGFAKRGVVPESGGTWYLPRLIGWAKATELGFLGRDLDAAESAELGLLNTVVDDDDVLTVAKEWAVEITANAPLAVQAMKRLFRHGQTQDFESHSHHVLLQVMSLFRTDDFKESVSAFMERRDPKFEGR